jgi:DNA-directed RNA polymerase specialized sigma24 family protein
MKAKAPDSLVSDLLIVGQYFQTAKKSMTTEQYAEAFTKGFGITTRYLQSRGASKDQAEEASQAAWARGWERLGQLRQECMVGFWVNAIALNELRRGIRRQSFHSPLGEVCGNVGVDCSALDANTILTRCSPSDRILFGHHLEGHTTEEIASLLGASQTAVRIRFFRARRAARRQMEGKASFRPARNVA